MNGRIAKWVPGILAAAAVAGFVTWLIADMPLTTEPASPAVVSASHADPAHFDAPDWPAGEPAVAATANEPLFAEAMNYYRAKDYSRASYALQKATGQQPDNPEVRFFLGVTYLLTDDTQAGIRELKVAEGLQTSPYVERIHFYLAKALLRQKDTINAMRHLNTVVDAGGNLAAPAKKLKFELVNNINQ